jgi:hypothetical protein
VPFSRFAETETDEKILCCVYVHKEVGINKCSNDTPYKVAVRTRKQTQSIDKVNFGGVEKVRFIFEYGS